MDKVIKRLLRWKSHANGVFAVFMLISVLFYCRPTEAQSTSTASSSTSPPVVQSTPETSLNTNAAASQHDAGATKFMLICAGCHSLSGQKLNGPDLSHVATWTPDSLRQAIKRMEKNVGPLTDADLDCLSELLRDGQVRERLKAEQARIQAQFMTKMAPPSAQIGRDIFTGKVPLANGGLACSACHSAAGSGGNLGPDLTGVFNRLGELPLVSAIEKASFKIMEPHYRNHPVTTQEAMHLTKYFSTLDPTTAIQARATFIPLGVGGTVALFVSLVFYFRSQRKGRDNTLQRRRHTT